MGGAEQNFARRVVRSPLFLRDNTKINKSRRFGKSLDFIVLQKNGGRVGFCALKKCKILKKILAIKPEKYIVYDLIKDLRL